MPYPGGMSEGDVQRIIDERLAEVQSLIRQLQGALGGRALIAGMVSAAGVVTAGTGFTVAKTGTGTYVVTFAPAVTSVVSVDVTSLAGNTLATFGSPTGAGFTVTSVLCTTGAGKDDAFGFVAVVAS